MYWFGTSEDKVTSVSVCAAISERETQTGKLFYWFSPAPQLTQVSRTWIIQFIQRYSTRLNSESSGLKCICDPSWGRDANEQDQPAVHVRHLQWQQHGAQEHPLLSCSVCVCHHLRHSWVLPPPTHVQFCQHMHTSMHTRTLTSCFQTAWFILLLSMKCKKQKSNLIFLSKNILPKQHQNWFVGMIYLFF